MKILYICTHNRCRSILSEAITNHLTDGKIQAYSAGSQPVGEVHPLSLKYLQARGINNSNLTSQSWDEFENEKPDIVITVCDSAAKEPCPVWFGECLVTHWGLPDPSKLTGSEFEIEQAFYAVMDTIALRIKQLMALPATQISEQALTKIAEIK